MSKWLSFIYRYAAIGLSESGQGSAIAAVGVTAVVMFGILLFQGVSPANFFSAGTIIGNKIECIAGGASCGVKVDAQSNADTQNSVDWDSVQNQENSEPVIVNDSGAYQKLIDCFALGVCNPGWREPRIGEDH